MLTAEALEPRCSPSIILQPDMAALVAYHAPDRTTSVAAALIGPHTQGVDSLPPGEVDYLSHWYVATPATDPARFVTPPPLANPQPVPGLLRVEDTPAPTSLDALAVDVLLGNQHER